MPADRDGDEAGYVVASTGYLDRDTAQMFDLWLHSAARQLQTGRVTKKEVIEMLLSRVLDDPIIAGFATTWLAREMDLAKVSFSLAPDINEGLLRWMSEQPRPHGKPCTKQKLVAALLKGVATDIHFQSVVIQLLSAAKAELPSPTPGPDAPAADSSTDEDEDD